MLVEFRKIQFLVSSQLYFIIRLQPDTMEVDAGRRIIVVGCQTQRRAICQIIGGLHDPLAKSINAYQFCALIVPQRSGKKLAGTGGVSITENNHREIDAICIRFMKDSGIALFIGSGNNWPLRQKIIEDLCNTVQQTAGVIADIKNQSGSPLRFKVVQKIEPATGNATVEIDRNEVLLFKNEQLPNDNLKEGDRIKVYVVDVVNLEKRCSLKISRTHRDLVKRLFEREVPEIFDGTVEIKAISREAGSRTKMAFWSKNPDVDPIGACIGPKGSRISAVVSELKGEKIDIVKYSEDDAAFITQALSPATVLSVEILPGEEKTKAAEPKPAPKAEEPKAAEPKPAPKAEEPKAAEPKPAPKAEEPKAAEPAHSGSQNSRPAEQNDRRNDRPRSEGAPRDGRPQQNDRFARPSFGSDRSSRDSRPGSRNDRSARPADNRGDRRNGFNSAPAKPAAPARPAAPVAPAEPVEKERTVRHVDTRTGDVNLDKYNH